MEKIFFIVHNKESYERHPNLIGFFNKSDLEGKPIRGTKNELIPDNSLVDEIKPGDKIVYYSRGDYLIRGIFEVVEKLEEDDDRIAKDWKRSLIQFTIKPISKPKSDVDFRNIIFSGKAPLDMFNHLENLKRQWGMSIGGRNYIRKITQHDYDIINMEIQKTLKPEIKKEEIEIPKFPRKHLEFQFKLVKILKSYGYQVHVARNDKANIIDKGEEVLESIPEFHTERVMDIASRVDCIAFSEYDVPKILVEVVDTPGTLTESLYRLNEINIVYPTSEEQRFYIIGSDMLRNNFDEKIESLTFRSLSKANCTFLTYDEIEEMFKESQKKKRRL